MSLAAGPQESAIEQQTEFDAFFRVHFAMIARAAALVACDTETGQDCAQDAFLRLFQRWDSMNSDQHAMNFAFKVAINLARSHVRKHLRLLPGGLLRPERDISSEMHDNWGEIADALAALPARQRACVVLVDYAGTDSVAAGRILGISANTVRVHVLRGRRALRARLDIPPTESDEDES